MTLLPIDSVNWVSTRSRGLDPTGQVFELEGEYYRAIYPHTVDKVQFLFKEGIVDHLIKKGLLVETVISDFNIQGFGLTLKHKRIPFFTRGSEWCRSLFREAALKVIDLNLALLPYNMQTIDYHWTNIQQQQNACPVWIDFGSICLFDEIRPELPEEFFQYFVHPLYIFARSANLGNIARILTGEYTLNIQEFHDLFGGTMNVTSRTPTREAYLMSMKNWLSDLKFPPLKTVWTDYFDENTLSTLLRHGTLPQDSGGVGRFQTIYELLKKERPRRVVDLGCNAGVVTLMAASLGADVCAVDNDEGSMEYLYKILKQLDKKISVTLSVRDVINPPDKSSLIKGDFVLALALTHHLSLTQQYRFPYIAEVLSNYTTDTLLTEFMPEGLGRVGNPVPDPLPPDYTLDFLIKAFIPYFSQIETIEHPVAESSRILLICKGRR